MAHPTRSNPLELDPYRAFGEPLCRAAERLIEAGAVREVRIHRNGTVVTGVVASDACGGEGGSAAYRVYIRRTAEVLQASECSCGKRGACIHVAAVSMALQQPLRQASTSSTPLPGRSKLQRDRAAHG